MDERRLRYFLAIVEDRGVTRAATRLHVAQPSLSQALRALERELGAELFHRVGRGLRLTAAGEAFVGPARQTLRMMDSARAAVGEVTELAAGTLQIAALATLAVDPLSALIGRFRREHPGVLVRVREPESAAALSTLVRAGECELGLTHLPLPQAELRTVELGEQELLFVLAPGGESGRALAPSALREVPLVVSPAGTSTRMLLEQALDAVGVTPRIAVETDAREAIVPLVLAGAGAALLPAPLAAEAARRGAIVRAARPRIVRRIGLVQRDGPLSPAARAFSALTAD
ncbi:MAG TPA: LysR substrate-binding domain-containing protein [Solirubrobacteraceae bacterium]|jgi:LysR family carnitine catabolism transcriptional activator|nr:LysR substrate-binding domain-containing protein [Solirubrobacteraceae bacterium]